MFVQGDSGIAGGFERALAGLTPGEERSFTLAPAEAYGELDPDGDLTVERSQFPAGVDLRPGMTFRTEAGGAGMQIWVKSVTGDELVIAVTPSREDPPVPGARDRRPGGLGGGRRAEGRLMQQLLSSIGRSS